MNCEEQQSKGMFSLFGVTLVLGVCVGVICIQISLDNKYWPPDRHLTTGIVCGIMSALAGLLAGVLFELRVKQPSTRRRLSQWLWAAVFLSWVMINWIPVMWYSGRE